MNSKPGKKTDYTAKEMLFDIDAERSVKTLHAENDVKYSKTKHATIDLSRVAASSADTVAGEPHQAEQQSEDDDSADASGGSSDDSESSSEASDAARGE